MLDANIKDLVFPYYVDDNDIYYKVLINSSNDKSIKSNELDVYYFIKEELSIEKISIIRNTTIKYLSNNFLGLIKKFKENNILAHNIFAGIKRFVMLALNYYYEYNYSKFFEVVDDISSILTSSDENYDQDYLVKLKQFKDKIQQKLSHN